jgi:glycosyltransferase involved in cell wall biosynthesis
MDKHPKQKAGTVWCIDSPDFGGSEIDLMRILRMVGSDNALVVHGQQVCPELETFLESRCIATEASSTGNSFRSSVQGLMEAFALLRRRPRATFIIWAHHSDSNRWLQLALALSGQRFLVVERLVPNGPEAFGKSRLSIPIKRIVVRRAYHIVLNASSQIDNYRKAFGLGTARLVAIPNSRPIKTIQQKVSSLRQDKVGLRHKLKLRAGPIVVCVARLADQKAQSDLIRAISLIQSDEETTPSLVLVGDGPERVRLETLAKEIAPGRVNFVGHQDDPLPWLAAADAFVLPSLCEGLPGALIEAMAAGLPCIATDVPGNRDLIQDGETGLLVPVKDTSALAYAINRMLSEPELVSRCVQSGFELVTREFDESTERAAWSSLISDLGRECENY